MSLARIGVFRDEIDYDKMNGNSIFIFLQIHLLYLLIWIYCNLIFSLCMCFDFLIKSNYQDHLDTFLTTFISKQSFFQRHLINLYFLIFLKIYSKIVYFVFKYIHFNQNHFFYLFFKQFYLLLSFLFSFSFKYSLLCKLYNCVHN